MLDIEVAPEQKLIDTECALRAIVGRFSESPLRNGKLMRDLIVDNYQDFRTAAVSVMRETTDLRGCRYLVTILWTNDLLIPILGDCTLPKELSRSIAQTAAKVDPQLHIRLIRFLISGMLEGKDLAEASANRLLEVLGSIADGPGIQRFIHQMLQHPSARIRSKVALLVERGGPGVRALASLVEDSKEDARVRANALEALWNVPAPEVSGIFRACLEDSNNRVRGNAIFGLYLTGDPQAIRSMFEMAKHTDPAWRVTAAWIMGRTKDPRFLASVGHTMLTSTGMLRRVGFKALEAIKKASSERSRDPHFSVNVLAVTALESGSIQMRVSLTYPLTAQTISVPGTAFLVHAESEAIVSFTSRESKNDLLCIAFIVPRRPVGDPFQAKINSILRVCLDSKTKPEQWSISPYRETGRLFQDIQPVRLLGQNVTAAHSPNGRVTPLAFSTNALNIRSILDSSGTKGDSRLDALGTMTSAFAAPLPLRAIRHIVVVVDAGLQLDGESATQLIADAKTAHFAISALSISPFPLLARVCNETAGTFRVIHDLDACETELPLIYASIRSQYILEFENPNPGGGLPKRVTLSVHAETCTGEGIWESSLEAES